MKRLASVLAIFAILAVGVAVWAEDEVFVRGKEKAAKGIVTKESSKGVTFKDGTTFAAETIDDIFYEVTPFKVRNGLYRPAFQLEKESLDPAKDAKRKANLDTALKNYQEAANGIVEPFAKRHAEYKAAALLARQAAEDGAPVEPAIAALKKFKDKNGDSWQIGACLQLLGRLQLEQRDYPGAKETYAELAQANVPDDVKQDAQLQVIHVDIRSGKAAEAQSGLDGLLKTLPKGSKHAVKARVAQAELLMAAKKQDDATKLLQQVAKETNDKSLKAVIHNALGVCLFDKEDFKGARWEFLWVDVTYNQDKNEHAKALYYLWKIFDQLGDAERGQECREMLLNDRAFAGTEWRARAQKESKTQ
jgi:TolA-binding protein